MRTWLWPLTNERFFCPWRPIPVAPIGKRILSPAGLGLVAWEALLFLPFFVLGFWPSPLNRIIDASALDQAEYANRPGALEIVRRDSGGPPLATRE